MEAENQNCIIIKEIEESERPKPRERSIFESSEPRGSDFSTESFMLMQIKNLEKDIDHLRNEYIQTIEAERIIFEDIRIFYERLKEIEKTLDYGIEKRLIDRLIFFKKEHDNQIIDLKNDIYSIKSIKKNIDSLNNEYTRNLINEYKKSKIYEAKIEKNTEEVKELAEELRSVVEKIVNLADKIAKLTINLGNEIADLKEDILINKINFEKRLEALESKQSFWQKIKNKLSFKKAI